jgi:hypothetical protein
MESNAGYAPANEEARIATIEANYAEAGISPTKKVQANYWGGGDDRFTHYLPDGVTFIVFRSMNDGLRAQYQRQTVSNMEYVRASGNTKMQADPGKERHILLTLSVVDWNFLGPDDRPVPFSVPLFERWLKQAKVEIVDELDKAIREQNTWMRSDLSSEEIEREIESLQVKLEEAKRREEEKEAFSRK